MKNIMRKLMPWAPKMAPKVVNFPLPKVVKNNKAKRLKLK